MRAHILLRARSLDLPPLALCAQSGNVTREVEDWSLLCEHRRGVGRRSSHMELADLGTASREVAQGNELGCSWCCHCEVSISGTLGTRIDDVSVGTKIIITALSAKESDLDGSVRVQVSTRYRTIALAIGRREHSPTLNAPTLARHPSGLRTRCTGQRCELCIQRMDAVGSRVEMSNDKLKPLHGPRPTIRLLLPAAYRLRPRRSNGRRTPLLK